MSFLYFAYTSYKVEEKKKHGFSHIGDLTEEEDDLQ